jgi:hypothetical protein
MRVKRTKAVKRAISRIEEKNERFAAKVAAQAEAQDSIPEVNAKNAAFAAYLRSSECLNQKRADCARVVREIREQSARKSGRTLGYVLY